MSYKQGLVFAMEAEAEAAAAEAGAAGGDLPEAADSLESDMLEVQDLGNEVDGQVDAIDSAAGDADGLAEIADVMEEAGENGGMDQTAARVAEVAVESFYKRLGVTRSTAMPAMESFGPAGNRVAATRIALEGVKETLIKVWEAIKAAIAKATAWIKAFLAKLFDANTKLGNRAAATKAAVAKLSSHKAAKDKIAGGSFVNSLTEGGKLSGTGLVQSLSVVSDKLKHTEGLTSKLAGWMSGLDASTEESFEKIALFNFAEGLTKVGTGEGHEAPADNLSTYRSAEFPGNRAIVVRASTETGVTGAAAAKAMRSSNFKIGVFNPKAKKFEGKEVPVLSTDDMAKIAASVVDVSAAVTAGRKAAEEITKARDTLMDRIKGYAKKFAEEGPKATARSSSMQGLITAVNRISASQVTSLAHYAITTGKASLDYVEKSMKEYKAEAKAA